ncbi:MAG: twin-arginine translocase TatA/TatE family subunit [Bacteroidales bacterium]|jgi:sec-independent protein translocase protein TatA|nr:twin-arginine translocase TatA/TatE family subunit [Bacteroidales bacterium]MBQ5603242.1 twin-arginine translocase TatA/TatE family subunit [Bacteroidales bacterium]
MIAFPLVFNFGFWEILLIVLVILLLFGGRRIPELMRGIGKGINNFKKGVKGEDDINK